MTRAPNRCGGWETLAVGRGHRDDGPEPHLDLHRISPDEQYRCGGSVADADWVERLLGVRVDG